MQNNGIVIATCKQEGMMSYPCPSMYYKRHTTILRIVCVSASFASQTATLPQFFTDYVIAREVGSGEKTILHRFTLSHQNWWLSNVQLLWR